LLVLLQIKAMCQLFEIAKLWLFSKFLGQLKLKSVAPWKT